VIEAPSKENVAEPSGARSVIGLLARLLPAVRQPAPIAQKLGQRE